MMSELARVEVLMSESDYSDNVWCVVYVNGKEWGNSVQLSSRDDFATTAPRLQRVVETVYRLAYRDGREAAKRAIRDAIGVLHTER
jgi:hypothetical protein